MLFLKGKTSRKSYYHQPLSIEIVYTITLRSLSILRCPLFFYLKNKEFFWFFCLRSLMSARTTDPG